MREGVVLPEVTVEHCARADKESIIAHARELADRRSRVLDWVLSGRFAAGTDAREGFIDRQGEFRKKKLHAVVFARRDEVTWLSGFFSYGGTQTALILDVRKRHWTLITRSMESNNCPRHLCARQLEPEMVPGGEYAQNVSIATYPDCWYFPEDTDFCSPQVTSASEGIMAVLLDILKVTPDERDWINPRDDLLEGKRIGLTYCNWMVLDLMHLGVAERDMPRLGKPMELAFRVTKSESELALMRRANALAHQATADAFLAAAKPDANENTISSECVRSLLSNDPGMRWASFNPFVKIGPGGARGHVSMESVPTAIPEGEDGQILFIETGASVLGYHAAVQRTAWLTYADNPELPKWLERVQEVCQEVLTGVLDMLRPGVIAGDVDAYARGKMRRAIEICGGGEMGCKCGYSIGAGQSPDWADEPIFFLSPSNRLPLRENMVFHCICNFIQAPNWGGIAISETAVVTKEGGRQLSESIVPQKIQVIQIPRPLSEATLPGSPGADTAV